MVPWKDKVISTGGYGYNCAQQAWVIDVDGQDVAKFATKEEAGIAFYGNRNLWLDSEAQDRADRWELEQYYR